MSTRPLRLSVTITLIILAGVFSALTGILGNLATSSIPPAFTPFIPLAWPAFAIFVILGIGITVWQTRRETLASSPSPTKKIPSPKANDCRYTIIPNDHLFRVPLLRAQLRHPGPGFC